MYYIIFIVISVVLLFALIGFLVSGNKKNKGEVETASATEVPPVPEAPAPVMAETPVTTETPVAPAPTPEVAAAQTEAAAPSL